MNRQQLVNDTVGGVGSDGGSQALFDKRYDDMKRFYEGRCRDLERELVEYKDLVSKMK